MRAQHSVPPQANALKDTGLVVYIKRDINYLTGRTQGDTNRPDLSATKSLADIMERREPYYMKTAVCALKSNPVVLCCLGDPARARPPSLCPADPVSAPIGERGWQEQRALTPTLAKTRRRNNFKELLRVGEVLNSS